MFEKGQYMIDIPFNEGKFLITSLDQNVKNRNRHLSRIKIKMVWPGTTHRSKLWTLRRGRELLAGQTLCFISVLLDFEIL